MFATFALVALGGCSKGGNDLPDPAPAPQYTITAINDRGGTIGMATSKTGDYVMVEVGTEKVLTAETGTKLLLAAESEEAYVFMGWRISKRSGDDRAVEYSMDNPWEIPVPAADMEVRVNFLRYQANGYVGADEALITQLNSDAVDTLTIGDYSFTLKASLGRNLMPILVDPEYAEYYKHQSGIVANNRLIEIHQAKIPESIELVKQYVIHEDSVWVADYETMRPQPLEFILERISSAGPKWTPRICVDVIAQVLDSQTQRQYYIVHRNVVVGAAY